MRIVFIGTVEFSRHCLKEVLKNGGNVVAVFTLAREDAGFHADYADLSDVAAQYGAPIYRIKHINDSENIQLIRSMHPDVIFVFGWSQLVSKQIRDIPPMGCIGTHPALLPRNRGRHPIIWALVEGLKESGLTFFYIDKGADSGDILWQKSFPISLDDDAGAVYEKLKTLTGKAIREFLPRLEQGTAPRVPQDHTQATYWQKRTEEDGEIHWTAPTMKTYNLVRALARPYVGAHTYLNGEKVLIWRARLPQKPLPPEALSLPPGAILVRSDAGFDIRTGDGYLTVLEYELTGRGTIKVGIQLGEQR